MCCDINMIQNWTPQEAFSVALGDKRTVQDTVKGDIDITVDHKGAKTWLRLTNVMLIKDLGMFLMKKHTNHAL